MQCHEFEDRLNAVLDDRQDPLNDRALAAHTSGCPECCQKLRGAVVLLSGLRKLATPALGDSFADGVVRQYSGKPVSAAEPFRPSPANSRRVWLAAAALLGSAAAVLLGLSIIGYARSGKVPGGLAGNEPEAAAHITLSERSIADAGPPRRGTGGTLATANLLIEAPRFPDHVRGGYRGAMDNLASSLPETVEHLHDMERIAPGIRPIRITFVMLWDALWRGFPSSPSDPPERQPRSGFWMPDAATFA